MQSFCTFQQKYIIVVNVDHININVRVETTLTHAKEYEMIKSSIKSFKLSKKFKFNIFSNNFNSTFRISLSINHDKIMSQTLLSSFFQIFRILIKQLIRVFVVFKHRYIVVADAFIQI